MNIVIDNVENKTFSMKIKKDGVLSEFKFECDDDSSIINESNVLLHAYKHMLLEEYNKYRESATKNEIKIRNMFTQNK